MKRPLVTGPLSSDEMATALRLRAMGWCGAAIAREMFRSAQAIGGFFAKRLQAEQEAEIRQRHLEIEEAVRRQALAADRDYMLIASLWTRGVAVYAILDRVNRDRKTRGLRPMEMGDLHALVVQHGLSRPEPVRPRMAA